MAFSASDDAARGKLSSVLARPTASMLSRVFTARRLRRLVVWVRVACRQRRAGRPRRSATAKSALGGRRCRAGDARGRAANDPARRSLAEPGERQLSMRPPTSNPLNLTQARKPGKRPHEGLAVVHRERRPWPAAVLGEAEGGGLWKIGKLLEHRRDQQPQHHDMSSWRSATSPDASTMHRRYPARSRRASVHRDVDARPLTSMTRQSRNRRHARNRLGDEQSNDGSRNQRARGEPQRLRPRGAPRRLAAVNPEPYLQG